MPRSPMMSVCDGAIGDFLHANAAVVIADAARCRRRARRRSSHHAGIVQQPIVADALRSRCHQGIVNVPELVVGAFVVTAVSLLPDSAAADWLPMN